MIYQALFSMKMKKFNTSSLYNPQVSSAANFCKQFGPRSGPTFCQGWSESKLFDTERIFRKIDFEKNQQTTKAWNITQDAKC